MLGFRNIFARRAFAPAALPAAPPAHPGPFMMVLTGAGISAESGIPTYRGNGGLWRGTGGEDMGGARAWAQDPAGAAAFYDARRAACAAAGPNAAHLALAELGRRWPGPFLLVTTNVDDLHERTGSELCHHLHGSLDRARCPGCGWSWDAPPGPFSAMSCPRCGRAGPMRPAVVMFGERPLGADDAMRAADLCDVFAAIGCGGAVTPASLLPRMAWENAWTGRRGGGRCRVVEINPEPTGDPAFTELVRGTACAEVPRWAEAELAGASAGAQT